MGACLFLFILNAAYRLSPQAQHPVFVKRSEKYPPLFDGSVVQGLKSYHCWRGGH